MPAARVAWLTAMALLAFAGNSLLCRAALAHTSIDAASFTLVRLLSGALVLWLLARRAAKPTLGAGSWTSALALFVYAAAFSYAYLQLTAAAGALLLFGAVQATMILHGLRAGERLRPVQVLGLALALAGLVGLLLPGLAAPPLSGALLMLAAGIAWGVYSLRGRRAGPPLQATTGNFLRAVPMAMALWWLQSGDASVDAPGIVYAVLSGALASGVGYALWYAALPSLAATTAASLQLAVPVLAALGGVLLIGEPLTPRLLIASAAILGGIALVVAMAKPATRGAYGAR